MAEESLAWTSSWRRATARPAVQSQSFTALLVATTIVASSATVTRDVRADELRRVRLRYARSTAASSCMDESKLRESVALRLGYDPFTGAANEGSILNVTVSGWRGELNGVIEMRDESGTLLGRRLFRSAHPDCSELSASMALAMAMAIDPLSGGERSARTSSDPPAATAEAPTEKTPENTAPNLPQPHVETRTVRNDMPPADTGQSASNPSLPRWQLGVAAGASGWGAAPSIAPILFLQAGARLGAFSLTGEGRVQLAASARASGHEADISASLLGGSIVSCLHMKRAALCFVPFVGQLRGSATTPRAQNDATLFSSLGLRAEYEQPLVAPLSVALFAQGDLTLTRTAFHFQDGIVWESAPLGLTFALAAKARFP